MNGSVRNGVRETASQYQICVVFITIILLTRHKLSQCHLEPETLSTVGILSTWNHKTIVPPFKTSNMFTVLSFGKYRKSPFCSKLGTVIRSSHSSRKSTSVHSDFYPQILNRHSVRILCLTVHIYSATSASSCRRRQRSKDKYPHDPSLSLWPLPLSIPTHPRTLWTRAVLKSMTNSLCPLR